MIRSRSFFMIYSLYAAKCVLLSIPKKTLKTDVIYITCTVHAAASMGVALKADSAALSGSAVEEFIKRQKHQ